VVLEHSVKRELQLEVLLFQQYTATIGVEIKTVDYWSLDATLANGDLDVEGGTGNIQ
jgi:hypothetical protein